MNPFPETHSELLKHWRNYTNNIQSPNSFIDWGFVSMISIALQRRVWLGSEENSIFANMYNILVAEPAVGKGLILKRVKGQISSHFQHKPALTPEAEAKLNDIASQMDDDNPQAKKAMSKLLNPPLLYPCGSDSVSGVEAFTQELAQSARAIKWTKDQPPYVHCSVGIILTEMSNLFKDKSRDMVNYLQEAYDCSPYFRYKTKHHGEDILRNVFVSIFAGCTPAFLKKCFDSELLAEGFASRAIFVFEENPRWRSYDFPDLTEDQIASREKVTQRVKQLSKLYGRVRQTEEAHEYAKQYFEIDALTRMNPNPKLKDYYGRLKFHMDKVAMCLHFADNDTMEIGIESVKQAITMLSAAEQKMHLALVVSGKNEMWPTCIKVMDFLKVRGPQTEGALLFNFREDLNNDTLIKVINDLKNMMLIKRADGTTNKWTLREQGESVRHIFDPKKTNGEKVAAMLEKYNLPAKDVTS